MTTTARSAGSAGPASARSESAVLVVILLFVGGMAGAASFTHMHDWSMTHLPEDTPDWFGWANAVVSELIPLGAALVVRTNRRHGRPAGYALFVLLAFVAVSLTAQCAMAEPSPSGWFVSALPALGFLTLIKLTLTTPITSTAPAHLAAPTRPASVPAVPTTGDDTGTRPGPVLPVRDGDTSGPRPALAPELLKQARQAAEAHLSEMGRPITRDALRAALGVSNALASDLLAAVRDDRPAVLSPSPAVLNGHAPSYPS